MDTMISQREQIIGEIAELPSEAIVELANFIEDLKFKHHRLATSSSRKTEANSGSAFLLAIAGLGSAVEDDISERDEEILANEIDPIRGWTTKKDDSV
ncbi:MAG: hypothetical protein EBE86_021500 [Hormoscilla sp. GUM202]|nr:hypothetical protein [Hormoscilla sp. GUM202]